MSDKRKICECKKTPDTEFSYPNGCCFLGFLAIGATIYYEDNIENPRYSQKEQEQQMVDWEKKYKKYQHYTQPRITDVNVNVDIFPKTRDFKVKGYYFLKNKSKETIDSIFINYNELKSEFKFDKEVSLVSKRHSF